MSLIPKDDKNLQISTVSSTSPKKQKPKPKVLDEDDYLEKLEKIIQRDFYPDIAKLKAQTEYLEAVERNDVEKIRDLQLRYSCRRTDKPLNSPRTPAYFETPIRVEKDLQDDKEKSDDAPSTSQEPKNYANPEYEGSTTNEEAPPSEAGTTSKLDKLGVDDFLAKYTSEDNASFEDIMERSELRNREKYAWMYNAEDEHRKRMEQALALPAADEQIKAITDGKGPRAASVQNWGYESKNALMFTPDGVEWSLDEQVRRKKMSEREIIFENTRFTQNPFSDDVSRQTMTKAAIIQSAVSKGKVDAQGEDIGFKHPMQYVTTPSPAPGVNESPLMTWGEIEGTPFRLDAGDMPIQRTPGPTFKMPEIPLRDKLAQELTEEISKRHRDKKQTAIKAMSSRLTPKFGRMKSVERLASLSPAAQRLATSKLGIRIGTDKALKASYTPSPARSIGMEKTPLATTSVHRQFTETGDQSSRSTASQSSTRKRISDESERRMADESLTDNLLQLRTKKPRAADFF